MNLKLYQVSMEIAGNTALWTRPDSGDSPCSYPAQPIPPCAACLKVFFGARLFL